MSFTVTVFTAGHACKPCQATKRQLMKREIPFVELPITGEIAKNAAAAGLSSAPLVRVSRQPSGEVDWWDGHRPDRIDALAAS